MTEEIANIDAVTTAAPAVEAAPVVEKPQVEPAKVEAPAITTASPVLTAPVEEVAPTEETAPVTEGEQPKTEEAAPVEQPPAEIPMPVFEPFVLPEGLSHETPEIQEYTQDWVEFELSSKTHEEMQKLGQKFLNRHIAELEKVQRGNIQAWENEKQSWANDLINDPELGGKRLDKTIDDARKFIRTHGGSPENQKELYSFLERVGGTNHKSVIGIFARAANSASLSEGTPKPAPAVASSISKEERFYKNS